MWLVLKALNVNKMEVGLTRACTHTYTHTQTHMLRYALYFTRGVNRGVDDDDNDLCFTATFVHKVG